MKNFRLKDLLFQLNNDEDEVYKRIVCDDILKELIGKTLYGVNEELVDKLLELTNSSDCLRFASYKGKTYLISTNSIVKLYLGKPHLISNYLMFDDEKIMIYNNGNSLSYRFSRPNHMVYVQTKKNCYIKNDMYYNDGGIEYYRVQKINAYDDSMIKFNFITNFHRINDKNVIIDGKAYIEEVGGIKEHEYVQEPYTIEYDGLNLDIDVSKYNQVKLDKAVCRRKK